MNQDSNYPRHIQVSNDIKFKPPYVLEDSLIYAYLRSYMNKDSKKSWPSLSRLKADTSLNERTISRSLKSLQSQGLITISKEGKRNCYTFTDTLFEKFEPFSYEFLSSLSIPPKLKGYWILLQQYTFKDDGSGYAKTTYTDFELSEILQIPIRTIKSYNKQLKVAEILSVYPTKSKSEIGEQRYLKLFNLKKISQDMFFVKEQLNEHDKKIEVLERLVEEQNRKLAKLEKKINADNALILE